MSNPRGEILRRHVFGARLVGGLALACFLTVTLCDLSCGPRNVGGDAAPGSAVKDRDAGPETPPKHPDYQATAGETVVGPPSEPLFPKMGKGRVKVVVLARDGRPVVRRSVTMWFPSGGTYTKQTDEEGQCLFDDLKPGEYRFCVTVKPNRECDCEEKTVEVESDVLHDLTFSGYRLARWTGKIYDNAGRRVSKPVFVGLYDLSRDRWPEQWWVIPPGMDFSVEGLSPGPHLWLLCERRMFLNDCAYGIGSVVIPDQLEFTNDIHLPTSIRGVVRSGSGNAVAGAVIGIVPEQFKPKRSRWAVEIQVKSDSAGTFEIPGVTDGVYTVWILKDYAAASRSLVVGEEVRKNQLILSFRR